MGYESGKRHNFKRQQKPFLQNKLSLTYFQFKWPRTGLFNPIYFISPEK